MAYFSCNDHCLCSGQSNNCMFQMLMLTLFLTLSLHVYVTCQWEFLYVFVATRVISSAGGTISTSVDMLLRVFSFPLVKMAATYSGTQPPTLESLLCQ